MDETLGGTVEIPTDTPAEDRIARLERAMARLQADFDTKIKYDQSKDQTIDALHNELQSYRDDLVFKILRPLALDLVAVYDDVTQIVAPPEDAPRSEDAARLADNVATVLYDIEEMLLRNGFELFEAEGDSYQGRLQQAQRVLSTSDPAQHEQIAARLRKGLRFGGERVVRREQVAVYRYDEEQK